MAQLTAREKTLLRLALDEETRRLQKDAVNADENIGSMYPRMLFRKTEEEDRRVISSNKDGTDREVFVANRFGSYLCDIIIVDDVDEAEAMAADGWDISPAAAYNEGAGIVGAVSAKDDAIANLANENEELRAQIAAMQANREPRRGRPPKETQDEQSG